METQYGRKKNSSKDVKESMIKKIQYHIDRIEYNQGSAVCCGWAFALTKTMNIFLLI